MSYNDQPVPETAAPDNTVSAMFAPGYADDPIPNWTSDRSSRPIRV